MRFAVHRNNVVGSLIDALADTFPVTQQLVGEAFFRAMTRLFVLAEPPRAPMLAMYGKSFPEFVESFPPADSVPYLADVARLELMRLEAYHAADVAPLAAGAVAQAQRGAAQTEDWVLEFPPSARLLQSPFAVVSIWAAHQSDDAREVVDAYVEETALVIRVHFDVEVVQLNPGDARFVSALMRGVPIGAAADAARTRCTGFDPAESLALLFRHHAITSLIPTGNTRP